VLLSREAEPGGLDNDDDGAAEKPSQPPKPAASAAIQPARTATRSDPD
jgi:hypothetical protein